jgi:GNAT superfamily N-acetyltransferase
MQADLESAKNDVSGSLVSRPRELTNGHKASEPASRGRLAIRVARSDEAQAIVELTVALFRGKTPSRSARFANAAEVEQLMKRGKFLLAENEKRIVGYAYLEPRLEASRLEALAVTPSQQRTGIGSQLLDAAERLSSSMHCLFMHLRVVNLHSETLRFCRRRGYVEFGIESLSRDQPLSLHCHVIRMCKRLNADCAVF